MRKLRLLFLKAIKERANRKECGAKTFLGLQEMAGNMFLG